MAKTKRKTKKRVNKRSKRYDSDLTDEQWALIEPLIPKAGKKGGRPRIIDIREVVNAIFYVLKTGCPWRYLPKEFPKWKNVYYYFMTWKKNGDWEKIHEALREQTRKQL